MANVEYINPHDFSVSVPLPSGGTLILKEARRAKDTHNIIPEGMVDEFGETWFDRFTGKDYLHKRRKGFPGEPAKTTGQTKVSAPAAPAKLPAEAAAKKKAAPATPKFSIEQVTAMSHAELRKALSDLGIETEHRAEETKLREQLADVLGLGSIPSFV